MRSRAILAVLPVAAPAACSGGETYSIDATRDCLASRGIEVERSDEGWGAPEGFRASGGALRLPGEVAIHFAGDAAEAESLADELTRYVAASSLGDQYRTVVDRSGNAVVSASLKGSEELPRTFQTAESCLAAAEPSER